MNTKKTKFVGFVVIPTLLITACTSFFKTDVARQVSSLGLRLDAYDYDACSEYVDTEDLSPADMQLSLAAQKKCRENKTYNPQKVSLEGVYYPYLSELSQSLTPQLEAYYDVFLLVNTDDSRQSVMFQMNETHVPKQHVRVVVKKNKGNMNPADNVFIRDPAGRIIGIDEAKIDNNVPELADLNKIPSDISARYQHLNVPYLVPSTTGSANAMKTVNGLYLVNLPRSASHRSTNPQAGMSFQTYIDTTYRDGRESGIAIHGTPSRLRSLLGVSRGSHGCARVHPDHARVISNYVRALPKRQIPKLGWKNWLSFELQPSVASDFTTNVPVMFVMFNGYDPSIYGTYASNTGH